MKPVICPVKAAVITVINVHCQILHRYVGKSPRQSLPFIKLRRRAPSATVRKSMSPITLSIPISVHVRKYHPKRSLVMILCRDWSCSPRRSHEWPPSINISDRPRRPAALSTRPSDQYSSPAQAAAPMTHPVRQFACSDSLPVSHAAGHPKAARRDAVTIDAVPSPSTRPLATMTIIRLWLRPSALRHAWATRQRHIE